MTSTAPPRLQPDRLFPPVPRLRSVAREPAHRTRTDEQPRKAFRL